MNPRAKIKSQHEEAVVKEFLQWFNKTFYSKYEIISRPDPPDAIVSYGNHAFWIECTSAFRCWEEAKELYSAVTPGEKPFIHTENPIKEPVARMAEQTLNIAWIKSKNNEYKNYVQKLGKGHLVVTPQDGIFSSQTLELIIEYFQDFGDLFRQGHFEKIYLRCPQTSETNKTFIQLYPTST